MPTLKIPSWNAGLGSRDELVARALSPHSGPILTQGAVRPKPEAGSLVQLHFNLLFCSQRVFRGILAEAPRADERGIWGCYSWGPWGESSESAFFFFCLPGSIAQPSGGYKYGS